MGSKPDLRYVSEAEKLAQAVERLGQEIKTLKQTIEKNGIQLKSLLLEEEDRNQN